MTNSLLLDEMFSDAIAARLRAKNHDVSSVVVDQDLAGLPDDQLLAEAAAAGRALVTANIKDFLPLDSRYRVSGRSHAGLILVSTKTFPQNRSYPAALTDALLALLDSARTDQAQADSAGHQAAGVIAAGQVLFLTRN
jgi:hypothetical protein